MEKVVFVVSSQLYNNDLLTKYIEKNSDFRAFNFFSTDEIILYMTLKPNVIIYGKDEAGFNRSQIERMSKDLNVTPKFLAVRERYIYLELINSEGEMTLDDIQPYSDIYKGLQESCMSKNIRSVLPRL